MKLLAKFLGFSFLFISSSSWAQLILDNTSFTIGGTLLNISVINKVIELNRNEEATPFTVGVLPKKGQKVLFEMELQDRNNWNNGDEYYCRVRDTATKQDILRPDLPLIDISRSQNVKEKSYSPRLTSGTYSWVYIANGEPGGIYEVICGGHKFGAPTTSFLVRIKKTIFE